MLEFKNKVIIIVGPTASGKSALALALAEKINGIIINADSSQVYKEAPILTSSPVAIDKKLVLHQLYNFISLNYAFKVTEWLKLVTKVIDNTIKDNKTPILVGGSGFYISALVNGLSNIPEPSSTNKLKAEDLFNTIGLDKFKQNLLHIDPIFVRKFADPYRLIRAYGVFLETGIPFSTWQKEPRIKQLKQQYIILKLIPDRITLYNKINNRFKDMITNGAINEVKAILDSNINCNNYKKIIGLIELADYINNKITLEHAINIASQKTRNYAKRQITWFKNQLEMAITFNENNIKDIIVKLV